MNVCVFIIPLYNPVSNLLISKMIDVGKLDWFPFLNTRMGDYIHGCLINEGSWKVAKIKKEVSYV